MGVIPASESRRSNSWRLGTAGFLERGTDAAGNPITGEGFIQLPNVTIQQLETTVNVPDGGTLLLGGQKLAGEVEREMGVPLLSKIPIINRAFFSPHMPLTTKSTAISLFEQLVME